MNHTHNLYSLFSIAQIFIFYSIEMRFSWMRAQSKQDVDTLRNFITMRIVTITMKRLALATVLMGKVCSLHLPPLLVQLKSNSHKPTTLASVPVVRLSASYANWMLTCVLHTHTHKHYLSFSLSRTHTHTHYYSMSSEEQFPVLSAERERTTNTNNSWATTITTNNTTIARTTKHVNDPTKKSVWNIIIKFKVH